MFNIDDNKFKLTLTYIELNFMTDREKLTMKSDFNFDGLEADKWLDIVGFSSQIILNGKSFDKILPPSAR